MATPAPQGRDEHAARLPVLVALLGVVLQAWRFRELDQAIDDAWITLRVARHWVQTGQPFFNPGVAVEASTSFLWTALSATWVTSWPGDPIGPARWLGLAFHLLAVGVAVGLAGRLAGRWGPGASVARWVAALLLVTPGWLAYHALSGMETGLYALLTVLAVSALARQDEPTAGRASSWWLGVVLALLALVRPEGVLLAALAVGAVWWGGGRPGERWAVLAPVALAVVGMEVFRWLTFGDLVPNTFHAKPPNPVRGAAYLGQYLLWGLGGVGWLAAWPLVRRARVARAVLAGALVLGLGVAWSGGDWMRGFRRCAPISVALVPVAAAGATLARRRLGLALAGAWAVGNLAGTATGHDGERVIITQMAERQKVHLFERRRIGRGALQQGEFPGSGFRAGGRGFLDLRQRRDAGGHYHRLLFRRDVFYQRQVGQFESCPEAPRNCANCRTNPRLKTWHAPWAST